MSALLFRSFCHQEKLFLSKTPWSALVSTNSRYLSNSLDKDGEINRLNEENPFKSYKEKSESLDHFNQSLVVVKWVKNSPNFELTIILPRQEKDYTLPHPIWTKEETENVSINHRDPRGFVDRAAYSVVSVMRLSFDIMSGYKLQRKLDTLDERSVLNRFCYYCIEPFPDWSF